MDRKGGWANKVNVDHSETSWRCLQVEALIASCSGALVNAARGQLDQSTGSSLTKLDNTMDTSGVEFEPSN